MLVILLESLLMVLAHCEFTGYISRCPTNFERRLFGNLKNCLTSSLYHCIRDERNRLVETCNTPQQIPPGNFPIYLHKSDDIYYVSCPKHLYQPFAVWSNDMSDCMFVKSSCNSIGQMPCDNGNETEDATCRCDYIKGYVAHGQNRCCSPSSSADCSCQYRTCENNFQELDQDYNCVNKCKPGYEKSFFNSCEPISSFAKSNPHGDISPTFSTAALQENTNRTEQYAVQNDLSFTAIMIGAITIFILNVTFILIYGTYRSTWRPFNLKIFICFTYIFTMGLFFGICMAFRNEKRILAYVFTFIVFVLLCTTCHLGFSLSVHRMITDPEVYNEEYDKRVYWLLKAAKNGDLKEITRLYFEDYIDMDDVDLHGRSALHLAACEGQNVVLAFILLHNLCSLEAKDRNNRSAEDDMKFHKRKIPFQKYEKTLELLKSYRSKQTKSQGKNYFKEKKAMELITAAGTGDDRTIKRLHVKKTDMNLSNSMGQTALHAAVDNGMKEIVDYLIDECKVSPFIRWSDKRPIDIAREGEQEQKELIIKKLQNYMLQSLNIHITDNGVQTHVRLPSIDVMTVQLLNCASRGDLQQMNRFKNSGYDMKVQNYDLQTALHIAVRENQEHIVVFLLKECNQSEMAQNCKDRWNMTPWEAAKNSSLQSVYYTFLENCPDLAEEENVDIKTCKLLNAAAEGNLAVIESLVEEKIDMNQRDHGGRTALHLATCNNHFQVVEFLIDEAKVDISIPDRWNRLPADEKTSVEIKTKMEQCQISRNEITETKMSATEDTLIQVMQASSKGILHKQTDLRYRYFKMDTCDYLGNTPLHVAACNGKSEDVKYLLNKGKASPFVRNNSRKTPLELVVDKLTFMGENRNDKHDGRIGNNLTEIKDRLQKAMSDAKTIEIEKDNAFEKHDEKAKIFLFHNKIFNGDMFAVRRFLKTDSNIVNQLDYDSRSALHMAAAAGHTHLVEFLLNQGTEKNSKDRYNLTPLDEANMNGDDKMKQLL